MSDDAATPAEPKDTEPQDSGPTDSGPQDATPPDSPAAKPGDTAKDPLRGSRTSGIWAAVVGLGILLVLLIIFIAQNTQPVSVTFLSWTGSTPLSVALLIATTAGLFLAAAAGSLRILQLRRRVRHDRKR